MRHPVAQKHRKPARTYRLDPGPSPAEHLTSLGEYDLLRAILVRAVRDAHGVIGSLGGWGSSYRTRCEIYQAEARRWLLDETPCRDCEPACLTMQEYCEALGISVEAVRRVVQGG